MKRETLIWTILFVVGGAFLLWRATEQGGVVYVKPVENSDGTISNPPRAWTGIEYEDRDIVEGAVPSVPRTVGVWIAGALTLAIFSFLYGDNVAYKIAESIFVGASAAYWMVVAFWSAVMGLLVKGLLPATAQATFMPALDLDKEKPELLMLVPLAMGVMFLWQLSPKGGWISRWPLAFFIAVFAGLRLYSHFQADFVAQIRANIVPLIVFANDNSIDIKQSLWNSTLVLGSLACLTYFFFSVEHRGVVGGVARLGIYLLMITFGVGFALTVMSRYSLLIGRFDFMLHDWFRF